jgi:hypothetical protein
MKQSVSDRGMVTAEFAASFPTIIVVLAVALSAVGAATAQLRCVDAARTGARAVARGEAPAAAVAAARAAAPAGADVRVVRRGSHIRVEVRGRVPVLGPLTGRHWTLPVSADAVAEAEPTVASP